MKHFYLAGSEQDFEYNSYSHITDVNGKYKFSLRIKPQAGKCAYIQFNGLVVHRVPYHGWMHMADYGQGFVPNRENPERDWTDHSALTCYRQDSFHGEPSSSSKKAVKEAIVKLTADWLKSNPNEFIRADLEQAATDLRAQQEQADKLRAEATEAEQKLQAMIQDYAKELVNHPSELWPENIEPEGRE